jgi:uracil-DNA glycosylase
VVAPLGRYALECFVPGAKVSKVHGQAIEQAGWTYFPLYHPAAAFRVKPLRETMFADFAALPAAIAGVGRPPAELRIEPAGKLPI